MLKGVLLHAPLKQLTLSLQSGFVLKRSVFNLSELYPMEEWDVMMAKILNRFVKNNDFIRRFTAGKSGRY
jgi:MraZ protein